MAFPDSFSFQRHVAAGGTTPPEIWHADVQDPAIIIEYCRYHNKMMENEEKYDQWAAENGITLTKVSGLLVQRVNNEGELEVLLSDTGNKPWTHQPFGGKRDKGEGPVQTMVRELKEEAGQLAADRLVYAFENGKAYYYSSHIQMLGNGKALLIHGFSMNDAMDSGLIVENGDDSKGYLWASRKRLEGEVGKSISLTEQGERVLEQIFGFDRSRESLGELDSLREGAKDFRHPDWRYYGDPTIDMNDINLFDVLKEDLNSGRVVQNSVENKFV